MAQFRGTIQGARGETSRTGNKVSGLTTEAQSWDGAVNTQLWHNEAEGRDYARVALTTHHGAGTNYLLYEGPVSGADSDIQKILNDINDNRKATFESIVPPRKRKIRKKEKLGGEEVTTAP
jgi:hypothetical protein